MGTRTAGFLIQLENCSVHLQNQKHKKQRTMATMEGNEISFSQQENAPSEAQADFTSFQFLPEKIVDFSIMQVIVNFKILPRVSLCLNFGGRIVCGHGPEKVRSSFLENFLINSIHRISCVCVLSQSSISNIAN